MNQLQELGEILEEIKEIRAVLAIPPGRLLILEKRLKSLLSFLENRRPSLRLLNVPGRGDR